MILLHLLWGCTCAPAPKTPIVPPEAPQEPFRLTQTTVAGFPDFRSGVGQQLQLDRLPAQWKLPTVNLPPKVAAVTDEFVLDVAEVPNPKGAKRELLVLRGPMPFSVETDEQTFKPEGMRVTIDGKAIPFGRGPAPLAKRSTWRINGNNLILSHPEVPAPGAVKVRYEGVLKALHRHDPAKSELEPNDFTRYDVTLQGITRHGLLLPAPTVGEWEVTLPERGAIFESWIALERGPVDRPRSDGASVTLTVTVDDKETAVDEQLLKESTETFRQWRVDLGKWAGQKVKLRLVTDTRGNALFDWVFVGSPTVWGPPSGEPRRVIVVALDTTRPDHLSFYGYPKPTTPEFDRFAGSGVSFDRTWSTAPRTRPSFRSATTGRLPLEAVGGTNISEVFAAHNFVTGGIVANVHLQPRFDFDNGFDMWWFDGKANADDQVNRALSWLESYKDLDSYLFVHFMDPHMAYDAPGEYRDKFVTDPDPTMHPRVKRNEVLEWMKNGSIDDRRKKQLEELHEGELAYLSSQLGRLFDEVDRMPGRSLIIVHSDHGEEFWEHEGFEHNHSLYEELTRTILVFRPRGGLGEGRRLPMPASLMDIAPTLYDLFGFADAPPTDGHTLMPLLAGAEAIADRPIPLGYLQYSHERWGVVWNDHKYVLHTGTGREELYDLVMDPKETRDIAEQRELAPYRVQLGRAHGLDVGPGWRIRVALQGAGPIEIALPQKALAAAVLDPESIIEHRANVEWGELPRKLSFEVGAVTLSEDGRTVRIEPGRAAEGIVYVRFESEVDPVGATGSMGGKPIAFADAKRGRLWKAGEHSVLLEPGTVVVPPPSEADRMGIGPNAAGGEGDMELLCQLGYATDGCDEVAPPDDDPGLDPDEAG